jgi:hypothetical protein
MANFKKTDKDPFEGLEQEYRDAIMGMDVVEIKKRVAETALEQAALMKAKKEDGDLIEKQAAYKDANSTYVENTKLNKLKINFCKMVLDGMGK